MNINMRFRAGDDVRAVWILAVCVLAAGSYYIQTKYQDAIAASYRQTETLYRETVANTRIVRESAKLRQIENAAQADLARVSHDLSLSASTAALLSTLQESAQRFDTHVTEVEPGKDHSGETGALQETDLTIRVRGKFRNILRFVEDLSHHSILVNVSDTEMAVANGAAADSVEPRLDATVHATLYRLRLLKEKELRVAAAR